MPVVLLWSSVRRGCNVALHFRDSQQRTRRTTTAMHQHEYPTSRHAIEISTPTDTIDGRAQNARAERYRDTIQTPVDRSNPHTTELRVPDNYDEQMRRQLYGYPQASDFDSRPAHGQRVFFPIATDPNQNDKAREIKLLSLHRPHMRAFHYAWLSFFITFFGWFSIPPLMPTIKEQLQLTDGQVANSNIASVASTIVGRIITGPLCDRYGPRTVQTVLLVFGAIPVASAAFVMNYTTLIIVRFLIGLVGCSFIATTYWTSVMFCSEIVGRANALATGWGNLGAGATYLITPVIFDLFTINSTVSDDIGWRLTLVVPAVFMVFVGVCVYRFSDDCPHGNYVDLKQSRQQQNGEVDRQPVTNEVATSISVVLQHPATWILAYQYACCFGVELFVHNVLSLYYYEDFVKSECDPATDDHKCRLLTQTTAGLISSLFGLMCIFARAAGGYASDIANLKHGMTGRTVVHFVAFGLQALLLYLYGRTSDLSSSIGYLIAFGFFVQACTGTTYAIVPYVVPKFTGATSGIVGAGGNLGAMCWEFLFKGVGNRTSSFQYLSIFVGIAAGLTTVLEVDEDDWTLQNAGPYVDRTSNERTRQMQVDDATPDSQVRFVAYA